MCIFRRIFLALVALAAWPVLAGAAELRDLVDQLGADDFGAKIVAVQALGALGDARAVVALKALGDNALYTTADHKVVIAEPAGDGFKIFDPIDHSELGQAADDALDKVRQIFETGGKGHSCGIYSFSDDHIHRLALVAPVSRIMVRQIQSKSNAGTFTNGMPMSSSMGCGVWGGNITNENISLKHYMNVTWVSRPIPEDKPPEAELFGEFYNSETF